MIIGIYPTTVKIFPDTIPNGRTSINLCGAQNEVLAFQVAVRSDVATTLSVIGEAFEQRYVNTPNKARWGFDQPKPCYPDAIVQVDRIALSPNQTKALWVRATGGTVKIGHQEINVTVTRWPYALSRKPSLKTSIGLGGAGFARIHGTTLFSTAYWQHVKRYYDALLDYRLSGYHLPFSSVNADAARPYMTDERVTTFRAEGLNSASWQYIRPTNKAWIYNFDEPKTLAEYAEIRSNAAGYHQWYNGIKYGIPFYDGAPGTTPFDHLVGAVNLWIPQTDYYNRTKAKAKARQSAGDELWLYTSWAPRQGWCNLMINQLALEHRLLFWQIWAEDVTGYLYWHATFWDQVADPWTNQATVQWSDPGIYGDGSLFYPGPHPSIRLELIREGMQDYELLKYAENKLGRAAVMAYVQRLTRNLTDYTRDHSLFEQVRRELGEALFGAVGHPGDPGPPEPDPPPVIEPEPEPEPDPDPPEEEEPDPPREEPPEIPIWEPGGRDPLIVILLRWIAALLRRWWR